MLTTIRVALILVLTAAIAAPLAAADWPASIDIGGFTVTSVSGTSSADGSGKATGRISIPGDGTAQVDLVRTATGTVTGSTRSSFTQSGVRVEGVLMLDRRGLQGTGVIMTGIKPITDANITVNPQTGLSASGRVNLGSGFAISVNCDAGPQGLLVRGTSPRTATIDTPLAVYTFRGDVDVSVSGQSIATTAKGLVERKGKVGGVITSFGPISCDVDPASGQGNLNVGGTNITIDLW